jgi:hypothetical protein
MFDLQNTDNAANHRLRPIGGPWSFFSRTRILAGGQILEHIDLYNRVHEMFNMFSATDSRQNDYAEGFCNYGDDKDTKSSDIIKKRTQLKAFLLLKR